MKAKPTSPAFLQALSQALPPECLREADDRYRTELRKVTKGTGTHVALPRNTGEVATIVALCAREGVGLVPFAGGTGLVGGQVDDGPPYLAVSVERMNTVRGIWPEEGAMTVEAGAVLSDVHASAAEAGLLFPLSLASKGSARVGGLLATNAGGTAVLRYGNMRELTLGIEAVLPDGSVMNTAHRLRKNNTGYDLRHLMIGSEGTLGIITAATLRLFPQPREQAAAFLKIRKPADALTLLSMARDRLGDGVSGCELLDGQGLRWLSQTFPDMRQPLSPVPDWSVLLEVGLFAGDAGAALEELSAEAMGRGLVLDGAISHSETQRQEFWSVRETIPEANRAIGAVVSHDVSVPLSEIPALLENGRAALRALAPDLRFNTFGHVGDGNIHFNLFPAEGRDKDDYADIREALSMCLHDLVASMGGAISAEHGIGRFKVGELERLGDPASYGAMKAIKAALDPSGIMNPGAVLPAV